MAQNTQTLAARLARGQEAAFADLYDACADRLHHYLTGRLGSADHAADVLQSTFVRVVQSRRQFARVDNPIAYVFQIARNEAIATFPKPMQWPRGVPNVRQRRCRCHLQPPAKTKPLLSFAEWITKITCTLI